MASIALGTGLTSLFVFARQRRLAIYLQWFAVVSLLALVGVAGWFFYWHSPKTLVSFLLLGGMMLLMLMLTMFTWFLKRLDDAK